MSRQFKFRAWEEETKTLTYLGELFCWEHGYHPDNFTTLSRSISRAHIDIFTLDNEVWKKEASKRFILEQYTGLKDKNGKEIYEGDIVKNANWIGEVKFTDGRYFITETKRTTNDELLYWGTLYWDEVIGNIHENPDLLK
jgi:uncharacterized phage protein (TIGR01671 family)